MMAGPFLCSVRSINDGDADFADGGDFEPSLCCLTVGPGNDQDREGPDDNGVADWDGMAWVLGIFPMPPERIRTRRDADAAKGGSVNYL